MKIYVILKNADFTEGRGPMVFDRAFITTKALEEYLNSLKSGVYGWKPSAGETFYSAIVKASTNRSLYGGWEGYELKVVDAN